MDGHALMSWRGVASSRFRHHLPTSPPPCIVASFRPFLMKIAGALGVCREMGTSVLFCDKERRTRIQEKTSSFSSFSRQGNPLSSISFYFRVPLGWVHRQHSPLPRNLQPLQSHRRPSYSSHLTPASNCHTTATAITVNTHAELCSGMIALRTVPSSSLPALAGQTFKPPSTPPSRHPSTASPTRRNSGSMLRLSSLSRNTSGAASCLAHGTRLHGSVLCYELTNNVRLDSETHLLTPQIARSLRLRHWKTRRSTHGKTGPQPLRSRK